MPKSINQRIASIEDWLIQRSSTLIPHVAGFRLREWQGYLLALSMVATATLIRFAIAPIYGGIPYLAYFPAVTLTAILT